MNVLLITFSFPPAGGVGVLRALSLARYLPESDIRVDVLTARNAPAVGRDESLLRQVPASVTIHRTWTLDLPFALRKAIKKLLSRRTAPTAKPPDKELPTGELNTELLNLKARSAQLDARSPNLKARSSDSEPAPTPRPPHRTLLQSLRTFVANLLLPDPQIGWLPFALPAARRLIRSRHIDAVVITVPPFSSVRLATQLRKAFPSLPILIDFRDEWLTTTLSLVSFNSNARARAVAQQTESDAVHAATAVVAVTHAAVSELRKRYPDQPAAKFLCIPNGFEISPLPPATEPNPRQQTSGPRITLTYIGSVYGSTDPTTFLAAVASLPAEARAQLRIRFIGHIETPAYRAALAALPDVVETVGFLPQSEAIAQLRQSDYALLLTHDPINVSAKFYDYLGAGIPILAAVHPDGDVRRLLEETRAGLWADINNPAAIQRTLLDAVAGARTAAAAFQPDLALIAQYHRRPLAQRYAVVLTELAGHPR